MNLTYSNKYATINLNYIFVIFGVIKMSNAILEAPAKSGVYFYRDFSGFVEDLADHSEWKKFSIWANSLNLPYSRTVELASELANSEFANWDSLPPYLLFAQGEMIFSQSDITDSTGVEGIVLYFENKKEPPLFSESDQRLIEARAKIIVGLLRAG
jgi:hypothetical protein